MNGIKLYYYNNYIYTKENYMRINGKQKIVTVTRQSVSNQEYSIIRKDLVQEAARNLSELGLKLWLFFSLNKDQYEFAPSNTMLQNYFGMSRYKYDTAMRELIDKKYLISSFNQKHNCEGYIFVEQPDQS